MAAQFDISDVNVDRFNWFTEHPKYKEMLSWGFQDTGQLSSTLLVYLDLCEAKNWWNVELHPCGSLQMVYMTGKPSKKEDYVAVLPLQTKAVLSPACLSKFLSSIEPKQSKHTSLDSITPHRGAEIPEEHRATKTLTLAMVDSDSTIVYYRISNGLVSPDSGPSAEPTEEEEGGKEKGQMKGRGRKGVKRKGRHPHPDGGMR
ncbi:tRNA-splicing endonuclease subunit Sen15-like [Diadema antillarum]|uniref:tRNA-splicing endonuclease subunit Sen15-like n=1 Tax=Diadema antillarum TaxID=105358 RepID=UPI003A88FF97